MKCAEFNKSDKAPPGRQDGAEDNAVCRDPRQQQQDEGSATTDGVEGGMALNVVGMAGSFAGNGMAEKEQKTHRKKTKGHNPANVTLTLSVGLSAMKKNSERSMAKY